MLTYDSLAGWRRWQRRRQGVARQAKALIRLRRDEPLGFFGKHVGQPGHSVVVALDALSPSQRAALLSPAALLACRGFNVVTLAPSSMASALAALGLAWQGPGTPAGWEQLGIGAPQAVLSVGDYMAAGSAGKELANATTCPYFVVQHGVLTPFAPPPPDGAHLLAWSSEDARFWSSGRDSLRCSVIGSQLLWEAARQRVTPVPGRPLSFLGQLHGAELDWLVTLRTVTSLRQQAAFVYRPHPAEVDIRSKLVHAAWRRRGVTIVPNRESVTDLRAPVAGIFSTGLLEAAAAGLPAYAMCTKPPSWVPELWDRYCIAQLGSSTSTVPKIPFAEPAVQLAELLEEAP